MPSASAPDLKSWLLGAVRADEVSDKDLKTAGVAFEALVGRERIREVASRFLAEGYYLESLTPNQRFTDDKGAGVGFTNLVYQSNVPVIYDDQCPSAHMYFLEGSVTIH